MTTTRYHDKASTVNMPTARSAQPSRHTYQSMIPAERALLRLAARDTHAWEPGRGPDSVTYASCWSGVWVRYCVQQKSGGELTCSGPHCYGTCIHCLLVEAVGGMAAAQALAAQAPGVAADAERLMEALPDHPAAPAPFCISSGPWAGWRCLEADYSAPDALYYGPAEEQLDECFSVGLDLDGLYAQIEVPRSGGYAVRGLQSTVLDAVRAIPGRRWDPVIKLWLVPVRYAELQLARFCGQHGYPVRREVLGIHVQREERIRERNAA